MNTREIWATAYDHFQAGDWAEAEEGFTLIAGRAASDDERSQALLLVALCCRVVGRDDEAEEHLAQAMASAIDPLTLGREFLSEGDAWVAQAAFREAVRRPPERMEAQLGLGDALLEQGGVEAAIKAFERAIALNTRHPLPRERLVQALLSAGAVERAVSQLAVVLQAEPNNVPALLLRADLSFFREDYREAIAFYRQAAQRETLEPEVYENLAGACFILDDMAGAVAAYEACVKAHPAYWPGYLAAARLSEHAGWASKARTYYLAASYMPEGREEATAALARLDGREDEEPFKRLGSRPLPPRPRSISERLRESGLLAAESAKTGPLEDEPEFEPELPLMQARTLPQAPTTGRLPRGADRLSLPPQAPRAPRTGDL